MDFDALVEWWKHFRFVWAGLGLCLALVTGVVVWRARGLLDWKRSQRRQMTELRRIRDEAENARRQALDEVIASSEAIWRTASPDLTKIAELPGYWRRIAACYHPQEPRPEECLSIGQLLTAGQAMAAGLEQLLGRPGFDRLGRLRVRQLRRTYDWYARLQAHPAVSWIMARRRLASGFGHTLRFVLPDPLTWIAYLSQRLTIMMAVRCLLMDIYLFTGKLAVETFAAQGQSISAPEDVDSAEAVLDAYEAALAEDCGPRPDELDALRNQLVGLPSRLWNPPGLAEWRQAVEDATNLIAAEYFPASPDPLYEAQCRVLLNRGRYWLQAMAEARRLSVVRPLYRISLKNLIRIKTTYQSDLLRHTGKAAAAAWTAWSWARWPIKILRWVRRRSPVGVAVEIGFTLSSKAVLNYLARLGFDRACQEMDHVYRLSSTPRQARVQDENQASTDSLTEE